MQRKKERGFPIKSIKCHNQVSAVSGTVHSDRSSGGGFKMALVIRQQIKQNVSSNFKKFHGAM